MPSAPTGTSWRRTRVLGTTADRRGGGSWADARRRDRGAGHADVAYGYDAVFGYLSHILPIPPDGGATRYEDRIRAR